MKHDGTTRGTGGSGAPTTSAGAGVPSPFRKPSLELRLSLSDLDPALLVQSLDAVLNSGALISLGRTSDGGAIGVYLTHNKARFKEWASDQEKLETIFEELREWGDSMS